MCFGKGILMVRDKEEEKRKRKMKTSGSKGHLQMQNTKQYSHVFVHGMTMREVGLQAHLLGFYTTYAYSEYMYSKNFSTCCKPLTLVILVILICSHIYCTTAGGRKSQKTEKRL